MALPATESFTGALALLADPPWAVGTFTYDVQKDGTGLGSCNLNGSDCYRWWDADTFPNDQYGEITWASTPTVAGNDYLYLQGRGNWGSGQMQTGYWAWSDGLSDTAILRVDTGSLTSLGTANATTFVSGDVMRLELSGTSIKLLKNGSAIISVTDANYSGGPIGMGGYTVAGTLRFDNFQADALSGGGPPPGTHVVSGRGNFAVTSPNWLQTAITGRPGHLTAGMAEPPNWYHTGMLSWGTSNGVLASYPITRDLDLVELPAGMTIVYYEFIGGVTATIVELASP